MPQSCSKVVPFPAPVFPEERAFTSQAQDLAYQALEAPTTKEARRLAQRALKLDPDCVDALIIEAETLRLTDEEYLEHMLKAVRAGEKSLGRDFMRQHKGSFWSILKTRPYMRAKWELAHALLRLERTKEAVREFESMLQLDPRDHVGARDRLLGVYMVIQDFARADRLFRKYRGDAGAVFAWARVLRDYLSGDEVRPARAFKFAMCANPHFADLLTGRKKLPKGGVPDFYVVGEASEAAAALLWIGPAWLQHPDAIAWLDSQVEKLAGRNTMIASNTRSRSTNGPIRRTKTQRTP